MQIHVSALCVGHHQVVYRTKVTIQCEWYLFVEGGEISSPSTKRYHSHCIVT